VTDADGPGDTEAANDTLPALICDADPDTAALSAQLVADAGFEVVGVVDTAVAAVDLARLTHPRLIVLDQDLPHVTGLAAIPDLLDAAPHSEILLVTRDESAHDEAMRAGAFGVVYKTKLPELEGALRRAREFIEGAGERDADDRRTGHDRRHHQDWQKTTSERREHDRRDD
jgi:DNA-binding NarL/FixJ family response regulator